MTTLDLEYPPDPDTHEEDDHDGLFWQVGGILAVMTLMELSTYWWDDWFDVPSRITNTAILVMMAIKFVLIAMFFMHLKWEAKMLRGVFFGGFFLAMACYVATLTSLQFLDNSGNEVINDPPALKEAPTTVPG